MSPNVFPKTSALKIHFAGAFLLNDIDQSKNNCLTINIEIYFITI